MNNTITAGSPNQGNQGIQVSTAVNAVVTYAIEGNKIGTPDGTTAAALLNTGINVFNGTLTTPNPASISGTVKNNIVINDNSAAQFSSNGMGIRLFNNGYGTMNANVSGNTVSKISADYGIYVTVASNSGTANATGSTSVAVTGNTASTRSDALDAIRVEARGRSTMCTRISGNFSASGAHGTGFFGLETRQAQQTVPSSGGTTYQATFNLEGLTTGLQTNHTTIVNYLHSQNAGITLADTDEIHTASGGITGVAANSCVAIPQ